MQLEHVLKSISDYRRMHVRILYESLFEVEQRQFRANCHLHVARLTIEFSCQLQNVTTCSTCVLLLFLRGRNVRGNNSSCSERAAAWSKLRAFEVEDGRRAASGTGSSSKLKGTDAEA